MDRVSCNCGNRNYHIHYASYTPPLLPGMRASGSLESNGTAAYDPTTGTYWYHPEGTTPDYGFNVKLAFLELGGIMDVSCGCQPAYICTACRDACEAANLAA